ncbi:GNAT family N-acetyltransferase [Pseudarthrobacter sulfonivorans]|uniref:GNAT family N-acetyltransferase n=1 Tax=Pseudarthrobacter sulfonivorans TaxID=121292 RepID=UPI00286009F5|nr:GNAT family N-acetyltransferase [Pseudarthrobacter sulfonivorans]MDR6416070.1 RimJ/RimL family protein N-acetyltransferase [Pseudarthrobacter sulfonivorans]
MSHSPEVRLADINEHILERLLALAQQDASPDDVTPPLGNGIGWNAERTGWFRAYHRAAAAGLDGPAGEKSWAVLYDGSPAGSVRLKRTAQHDAAETGIWLGRSFRARGVGGAALKLVLAEARVAGLRRIVAHTTAGNAGAQRLLTGAGAALTYDDGGAVSAVVVLSCDSQ